VAYDSDPIQVRDILTEIARTHPQVVASPAPSALLVGFGDSALEFELRCVVADVESGGSVKSDLNFAILKRFREAAIEIPHQLKGAAMAGSPDCAGQVSAAVSND
jgi:small-conductance mechanosensitive channel